MSKPLKFEPAFPCNRCGACCRSVGLSPATKHLDNGSGICQHLDPALNTCQIYKNRPEICRIEQQYQKHFIHQYAWSDFVAINLQACNQLLAQLKD